MISEATAERRKRLRKEWRYGDGDGDEEAERFWERVKMRMSNGRELQTAQLSPPPPPKTLNYTLFILGGVGGKSR